MKKIILSSLLLFACINMANAQQKFGYFSCKKVLEALPEYNAAQKNLAELKEKYAAETKRVEADFNSKYEEFLEGQKEFPAIILQKRQTELQEMMEKNIAFKREARRLYAEAEREAMNPIKQTVKEAVAAVGKEEKCAFVLNTDSESCAWIDPEQGTDLTDKLISRAKVAALSSISIATPAK
ncbi:MAG: OmpH family outer membrane protein [Prevotellaceae bacterium]|nr:OmpH family outer membrane protein [Prevotellaceae bacterium]